MPDLVAVYNSFDAEDPLLADDTERYVDLSSVRGNMRIAPRLVKRIELAGQQPSYHLLTGHVKCGKTTELNRTAKQLEQKGYATVVFDITKEAQTYAFDYTAVLLVLAGQVVTQLGARNPPIKVAGKGAKKLAEFLIEKEITVGRDLSLEAGGKVDAEIAPGLLASLLGKFGIGVELKGGFQRNREITYKIERDTQAFQSALEQLILDARERVQEAGYKGLVVICDGSDKLSQRAPGAPEPNQDLHVSLFVEHRSDLCSPPCHIIYSVPISIQANLGPDWGNSPEFVPAIPVNQLFDIDATYAEHGRRLLAEVVDRRLAPYGLTIDEFFESRALFENLVSISGGHISDLLLMIRDALVEAQIDERERLNKADMERAILTRALEYSRLIESIHLPVLSEIAQTQLRPANGEVYRELVSRRLTLEYLCGDDIRVDLHPLVAASDAYRRWQSPSLR
ncbi:MAG TPA: hypothetical protein VF615_13635 [Longimicrobiaceae bacterium]|jgi:hypothetical protein